MRPMNDRIRNFLFPSFTPKFLIRIVCLALIAYLFFGYVCTPFWIEGSSMEPTYHDGGFNFCWKLRYLYSRPQRRDVVTVRFAGDRVMLLKRIVALEGEVLEFRGGKLFVNGRPIDEPYVQLPCDWNLPPRVVERDSVYVAGDNRSMYIEGHYLGQTSIRRIVGVPLW